MALEKVIHYFDSVGLKDRVKVFEQSSATVELAALAVGCEPAHIAKCQAKLDVLLEQRVDLTTAIDQLLDDIAAGRKYMKVYRQMKMYNDPETNPVLYGNK